MGVIKYRSNTGEIEELLVIKGDKGEKGDTGEKGDKGDNGEIGEAILFPNGWGVEVGNYMPAALKYRVLVLDIGDGKTSSTDSHYVRGTVVARLNINEGFVASYSGIGIITSPSIYPAKCEVTLTLDRTSENGKVAGSVSYVNCKMTYFSTITNKEETNTDIKVLGVYGLFS